MGFYNLEVVYYIVSQEVVGTDQWYDLNTTVQTTGAAAVNGPVYSSNGSSYTAGASANHMYGAVDFRYALQ